MKRLIYRYVAAVALTVAAATLFYSCGGKDDPVEPAVETLDLQISVVTSFTCGEGDEISFKYYNNKGPLTSDIVVLKSTGGTEYTCRISRSGSGSFSFVIPSGLESGTYSFIIRRGTLSKTFGSVSITVEKRVIVDKKEGFNVYGIVTCDDVGVSGVVVSDGVDFTTTDKDGIYYLKSGEKFKNVFISIPSGYEAVMTGVFPAFHADVDGNATTYDRCDFMLNKVEGQDNHTMIFLGDMHLANRTSDLKQFEVFADELKSYFKTNSAKHNYVQTLGDMTWDLYWYANNFTPAEYVAKMNTDFKGVGVPFFNCIGNHDHEMGKDGAFPIGDYDCEVEYRKQICPNFYSYNVGKIHYVVLDDIFCTNPGDGTRSYDTSVTAEQLAWLQKDLSYVSKSTPVVVITHAPVYTYAGKYAITNAPAVLSVLASYKTYFITGHTHRMYAVDDMSKGNNMELNSGSVCATWWWTGHLTPGLYLARDGSNGGYRVFEVNGTDIKWYYKSIAKDASVQFRTYDGNELLLSDADVPNATAENKAAYIKTVGNWAEASTANYVYIEVWDYDPSWKVEVTENGKSLSTTQVALKDPLHFLAYAAKRYNDNKTPTSGFATSVNPNMFRVQATSATSTLEIKVTDRFGRVYTETMKRPRAFSLAEYNK